VLASHPVPSWNCHTKGVEEAKILDGNLPAPLDPRHRPVVLILSSLPHRIPVVVVDGVLPYALSVIKQHLLVKEIGEWRV
jgi:hypothetical protein